MLNRMQNPSANFLSYILLGLTLFLLVSLIQTGYADYHSTIPVTKKDVYEQEFKRMQVQINSYKMSMNRILTEVKPISSQRQYIVSTIIKQIEKFEAIAKSNRIEWQLFTEKSIANLSKKLGDIEANYESL